MACILTSGYTLDCRDQIGGIKQVYFCERNASSTFTQSTGTISAFVLCGSTSFRKYEQNPETATFTEAITPSEANGTLFYDQDLEIVIPKWNVTLRNELYLLAQQPLWVIIKDANDTYKLMGATRFASMQPSTTTNGKAAGDMAGYTLKFKAKEPVAAYFVSSSATGITL